MEIGQQEEVGMGGAKLRSRQVEEKQQQQYFRCAAQGKSRTGKRQRDSHGKEALGLVELGRPRGGRGQRSPHESVSAER